MVDTTSNLGLNIASDATQRWIDNFNTIDSQLVTRVNFGWTSSGTSTGTTTITTGFEPRYLELYGFRHPTGTLSEPLDNEYNSSSPPSGAESPNAYAWSYGAALPGYLNPDGASPKEICAAFARADGSADHFSYIGEVRSVHLITTTDGSTVDGRGEATVDSFNSDGFDLTWNSAFEDYHVLWRAHR